MYLKCILLHAVSIVQITSQSTIAAETPAITSAIRASQKRKMLYSKEYTSQVWWPSTKDQEPSAYILLIRIHSMSKTVLRESGKYILSAERIASLKKTEITYKGKKKKNEKRKNEYISINNLCHRTGLKKHFSATRAKSRQCESCKRGYREVRSERGSPDKQACLVCRVYS